MPSMFFSGPPPAGFSLDALQNPPDTFVNSQSLSPGATAPGILTAALQIAQGNAAPAAASGPSSDVWQSVPDTVTDPQSTLPGATLPGILGMVVQPPANSSPGGVAQAPVSADSIKAYLQSVGSPMQNQGANFMAIGQKYDLDPRLLVALAGAETTFGKNITRGQYNALNDLYNGPENDAPFPNWERAINGAAKSLTNPANEYDLSNTDNMYGTYCKGPGCAVGLNNVNRFMRDQGADPNALRYPSSLQK